MSWNYRVIRHKETETGIVYYAIHEVFYNEQSAPYMMSERPITPHGDSPEELIAELKLLQDAADKPALDYMLFFSDK